MLINRSYFGVDAVLGIALGTGYMTSLRFFGPVGISEILVLITISLLFIKCPMALCRMGSGVEALIKAYLLFSVYVVFPIVTLYVVFFLRVEQPAPGYVVSFVMGFSLLFLLVEGIRRDLIRMKIVALYFCLVFILTNMYYFLFVGGEGSVRVSSFSDNPNQLLFYISSLSLLLVIYQKKLFALFFLPLCYIGIKSGSDAYTLSLGIVVATYCYLRLVHSKHLSTGANYFVHFMFAVFFVSILYVVFKDQIVEVWLIADEGNARISLLENGVFASLKSPLFGWGAGAYSGLEKPFGGWEAHNTFIDLAMQFGVLLPILIYSLMIGAAFTALKQRQFLVVSFMVAYMVSGLFHFSGRHFIFWVEIAVFWSYVFPIRKGSKETSLDDLEGESLCVG